MTAFREARLFMSRVALAACCILIAGCGYTTRSMVSSHYRTIYITPFTNQIDIAQDYSTTDKYKINKPLLEKDITNLVTNRFLFDGNLKPVRMANADLVLKGDLVEFRRDPLRYTDNDEVEEYRLNLVVNIALTDTQQQKVLWEEKNFTGTTTYFLSGSLAKSESVAINDAIDDLARRIVERTVEEW